MDTIDSRTFLEMIWPQSLVRNETVELRVIHRSTGKIIQQFHTSIDDFLKAASSLGEGYDIYFSVCTRFGKGGKKRDCYRVKAVWVDFDREGEPDLTGVPKPDLIIKSGGGTHLYWLLNTPVMVRTGRWQEIEAINRSLCKRLGGDKMCIDISRILRVPGFNNHKYNPPRMVTGHAL